MKKELKTFKEVKKAVKNGEKVVYDFLDDKIVELKNNKLIMHYLGVDYTLDKARFQRLLGIFYSIS